MVYWCCKVLKGKVGKTLRNKIIFTKEDRIAVIAPHPDDEILGCGGTIARHISEGNDVYVCIVTSGFPPLYEADYKKAQKMAPMFHGKRRGISWSPA